MNRSLIIVFFLLLINHITAFGQASYRDDPSARAELATEKMVELIPLSKEKTASLKVLNLKYAKRVQSEIIDSGKTRYQQYKAMQSINREKEKELKSLYSKEEFNAYKHKKSELKKWARQQMRENGFGIK